MCKIIDNISRLNSLYSPVGSDKWEIGNKTCEFFKTVGKMELGCGTEIWELLPSCLSMNLIVELVQNRKMDRKNYNFNARFLFKTIYSIFCIETYQSICFEKRNYFQWATVDLKENIWKIHLYIHFACTYALETHFRNVIHVILYRNKYKRRIWYF